MMIATLPERLLQLTQADPERVCLRFRYADRPEMAQTRYGLMAAILSAAGQLAAAGAARGDLVVIVQQDMRTLVATFFGAAWLGAIPSILPFATEKLDPARYRASMVALLELARPAILATDLLVERGVRALLPGGHKNLPVVATVKPECDGKVDLASISPPGLDPDDIALLQHSSGTTGLQKGVALSHRAIFEQLDAYGQAIGFTADDVIVSWLPLYHDMGLIAGFLMPLLNGACLVMMSPFDWVRTPQMLMHAISDHRGTLCWLPNFAFNFCAQKIRDRDLEGVDLSSIRAIINCSEPVYEASHHMFAERFRPYGVGLDKLAVCYAMAETVFGVSQTPIGLPARIDLVDRASLRGDNIARPVAGGASGVERLVSTGKPIAGMQVCIMDANHRLLPDRHVGEIAVRSPYMLTEYYHRPDATAAAFHEGWYLTGDMGYLADQEVFVLGRKKDLLIVGGRNIYPQDLEALASTVKGVHPGRVAAFGIPNPETGTEDVGLVAEVDSESKAAWQDIRAEIRRAISRGSDVTVRHIWLVPRGWLIKTSSGKVARLANREKILSEYSGISPAMPGLPSPHYEG